jgi:hypothetical protein
MLDCYSFLGILKVRVLVRIYSLAPVSADSVYTVSVIHGSLRPPKNWKIKEVNGFSLICFVYN